MGLSIRALRPPVAALGALLVAMAGVAAPLWAAAPSFDRTYVDLAYGGNGRPGWVRAGDMDGDGDLDLVAGGGYALFVYENDGTAGGWARHGTLDGTGQIGANGAVLFDADSDGDLDVVCAKYTSDLGWWENPGGALATASWAYHKISDESRYLHDMILADVDQDGAAREIVANLNQGYWSSRITVKWLTPGADPEMPWVQHTIESDRHEGPAHGHAGLDTGDVDADGNVDLAYSNGWYEAPDNPTAGWIWHEVTTAIYGISNALLRDMDEDGDLDLVVSAGHHGSGVYWLEAPEDPIAGTWTEHAIDAAVHHPERLAVFDLWRDGDPDAVSSDLFFGEDPGEPGWDDQVHNIYVWENLGGAASWSMTNIAPDSYPSHLLQPVDLNGDGRTDLISEATGTSVVSYYENTSPFPTCQDDLFEPDDACAEAAALPDETWRAMLHCDDDWHELAVTAGATYEIATSVLVGGADTQLEIWGPTCGDFVTADDDSGGGAASLATFTATTTGSYRALVRQSVYSPGEGYSIFWECIQECGLCTGPDDLQIHDTMVDGPVVHVACHTIAVGPAVTVAAGGRLELSAGDRVRFGEGFTVGAGGEVTVAIDRSLR